MIIVNVLSGTSGLVAFCAYMSTSENSPSLHHIFVHDIVKTNLGSAYNRYSGMFTAPRWWCVRVHVDYFLGFSFIHLHTDRCELCCLRQHDNRQSRKWRHSLRHQTDHCQLDPRMTWCMFEPMIHIPPVEMYLVVGHTVFHLFVDGNCKPSKSINIELLMWKFENKCC